MESSNWPKHPLTKLMQVVDQAYQNQQYVLIHDKQGSVPVFFQYQKQLFDLGPHVVRQAMSMQTPEDTLEALRASLVHAWRSGQTLGISCSKSTVKFDQWATSPICPLNTVFNWTEGRKHANYFPLVKPEEQHGLDGVVNKMFMMQDSF